MLLSLYSCVEFRGKNLHLPVRFLLFVVTYVSLLIRKGEKKRQVWDQGPIIFKFEFFYTEI